MFSWSTALNINSKEIEPMPGLMNEADFHKLLAKTLDTLDTTTQKIAYIIMDVDHFSIVNQSYGYDIGYELLVYIAGILQDYRSENIFIAHRHEDMFCLFMIVDKDSNLPTYLTNKIGARIDSGFKRKGSLVPLSISAGIAISPTHSTLPNLLIQKATIALDYAKAKGKNTILMFEDWMYTTTLENAKVISLLQPYHIKDYIHMVYQPIYCAHTKKLIACESLLRMTDEEGNIISPVTFIPLAERSNSILELGYLGIEQVCKNLKEFIDMNPCFEYISINLSATQLRDPNLISRLKAIIERYQVDSHYLGFELTESIFIDNLSSIIPILEKLKKLGATLLLDDFGTGYSSLTYLSRLDIDVIKMDKEFITDILSLPKSQLVVKNMIDLSHALGINVIIEGVETEEVFDLLHQFGCDKIQGFLFSKPLNKEDFLQVLSFPTCIQYQAQHQTTHLGSSH